MKQYIEGLLIIITISLLGLVTFKKPLIERYFNVYIVSSGSMAPIIRPGALVFTTPRKVYALGEIIAFKSPNSSDIILHRIIKLRGLGEEIYFTTKGDVNKENDPKNIEKSLVKGKIILNLPYIGYALRFARTKLGLILTIYLPAALFLLLKAR